MDYKKIDHEWLSKYKIDEATYQKCYAEKLDQLFYPEKKYPEEYILKPGMLFLPFIGGSLIDKTELTVIRKLASLTGEGYFVVTQGFQIIPDISSDHILRLRFPVTITWDELVTYVGTSLLMFGYIAIGDYYVFGESGKWGKYVSEEKKGLPLNLWAFNPQLESSIEEIMKEEYGYYLEYIDDNNETLEDLLPEKYTKHIHGFFR